MAISFGRFLVASSVVFSSLASAQEGRLETSVSNELAAPTSTTSVSDGKILTAKLPEFSYTAYGYMTFSQFETFRSVQNLTPYVRRRMDLNEFAFEGSFKISKSAKVEFEVEIEHGGTGGAMEYEPFEEFGEFEQEIEKGGEIVLKEFFYEKKFADVDAQIRAGKFPIFISLSSVLGKPHRNPSVMVSHLEGRMIPYSWSEMGMQYQQRWFDWVTLRAGVFSGLNSEFFRTYSWVGGGYQRHFEYNNADNLATFASVELGDVRKAKGFAVSYYTGDSTGNRHKQGKVNVDAELSILSLMGNYKLGRFGVTAQVLRGQLENSDEVVRGNATLGGLAKPKAFSPLGHKAVLEMLQLSYDFSDDFTFFVKGEHVDTFADVLGNTNKNPRYNVNTRSAGFMWFWDNAAFMKAEYLKEKTELVGLPEVYQATVSFGFDLDRFKL